MKVLIIVPRFSDKWGEPYQIPLGLGYIASSLKQAGHEVFGLNLNHRQGTVEELVSEKIKEVDPDICATGALAPFLEVLKTIFSAAREAKPNIINIGGGGMVSGEPEMSLRVLDIDVGVVNEGEETMVELMEYLERSAPLKDVQGIVFKDDSGKIIETTPRPQIKDLGEIPWPDYELLETEINISNQRAMDSYFNHTQPDSNPRVIDMITSRSCPYSCTFCFHPVGKTYRERPLDDFFAELDMVVARYKVNMVAIIDELFSLKQKRLLEFCERIKPYNLKWMVQLHVMSAKEETLQAMYDAGCTYISYGIESMSLPVLKSMQKKAKPDRIQAALELTQQYKIGIQGNLLFGDKAETLETANETMHWWAFNRQYQINLTPLEVFPGSPDYYDAIKDGLITDREAYTANMPPHFNISQINNKNQEMMNLQVWVFQNSLLNMAPSKSFEIAKDKAPIDGGLTYDITWDCPTCEYENKYLGVVLPANAGQTIRLSCQGCLSRWDLENKSRQLLPDSGVAKVHRVYRRRITALLRKIRQRRFREIANYALADTLNLIPATFRKNKLYDQMVPREHVFRFSAFALGGDPLNPEKHNDFADILAEVGAYGAARIHYQQALLLDSTNARASSGIALTNGSNITDAERATYFVSWSDAAAPARKTQQEIPVSKHVIQPVQVHLRKKKPEDRINAA